MKFKLVNRKITFTKEGKMIFTADLYNEENPFENPPRLPKYSTINQDLIKKMVEQPGEYEYINNMYPYKKELKEYYLRVDENGKPVLRDGHAVTISAIQIWQKKVADMDTGELVWAEDPESVIARILFRHYIPVELK